MTSSAVSTKRFFRRAAVAAMVAAMVAGTASPAAAAGRDRPELRSAMQAFVDAGFAGMQLRVNDERGEWVSSAGVRELGKAAKPPANGRFRIGSSTKTFVATTVLQLVGEGRIGLDSSVDGYLSEFGLDPRITVRMLLQHTSGIFNHTGDFDADGTFVPGVDWTGAAWVAKRFHTYQPAELVRFALAKPARFEPGAKWNYSNTNYVLAAMVIEAVTGNRYGDEVEKRILRPLGLRGTEVPGTRSDIAGPHAHGYLRYQDATGQWKVLDVSQQNPSWISGGGEMVSTTRDLHTFFSALQQGKLLPAPLLAEMRAPHPDNGGIYGHYGLGVYVQDTGADCSGVVLNHNGSVNGYGSLMYSTPDGRKTLTASLTAGDAGDAPILKFPELLDSLVKAEFCG